MAVGKDIDFTSLVVELDGGISDAGKPIKLRRTLAKVSDEVTPEQAFETVKQLFALQVHSVMKAGQVETYDLYQM